MTSPWLLSVWLFVIAVQASATPQEKGGRCHPIISNDQISSGAAFSPVGKAAVAPRACLRGPHQRGAAGALSGVEAAANASDAH